MISHPTRIPLLRLASWAVIVLASCAYAPPRLLTLQDRSVAVNETLSFDVAATDGVDGKFTFFFRPAIKGAELAQIDDKVARFNWTPNPAQSGELAVTFIASDGTGQDTETIRIRVTSEGAPEMTSPDRFVFDPSLTDEVAFALDWQAPAAPTLHFSFDPDPSEWGARVTTEAKRVAFEWTPDAEQKRVTQHLFTVTAADADGHEASRTIAVVFRASDHDCDPTLTSPDVVVQRISDQSGTGDYDVSARVSDRESRILRAYVFYTDVENPTDADWYYEPLEQSPSTPAMWTGRIPFLDLPAGTSRNVAFQVCAQDDDDAYAAACDSWGCSAPGMFRVTAASSGAGSAGSGAVCAACSIDGDCGAGMACRLIQRTTGVDSRHCVASSCSPSSTDPACGCGELVINELLADPPLACPDGMTSCATSERLTVDVNGDGVRKTSETEEEFVEIVNASSVRSLRLKDVSLTVDAQLRFTFPDVLLAPGAAAVVFGGGDAAKFKSHAHTLSYSSPQQAPKKSLTLVNGHGSVVLGTATRTFDAVDWSTRTSGQSIVRQTEERFDAPMVAHPNGSYSPGTRSDGTPFGPP